jgi:hypothetical protein
MWKVNQESAHLQWHEDTMLQKVMHIHICKCLRYIHTSNTDCRNCILRTGSIIRIRWDTGEVNDDDGILLRWCLKITQLHCTMYSSMYNCQCWCIPFVTMHMWQYQIQGAQDKVAHQHVAVGTANSVMLQNKHESIIQLLINRIVSMHTSINTHQSLLQRWK